ncbi:AmmeMemoRadiSam system radical SAM enzyme [Stieleria varia]|uniref:Uncharacterized protein n=1 Tax=Stieleria varia TaxID=2528005 RepID=A0A5C6AYV7_9BACT|nr:AmmeMemoRadiSam system radical SAM enzyme [Stieleria varia]TWU04858.1 hypothetical protein Pla52n_29030 [Stieleria varia]
MTAAITPTKWYEIESDGRIVCRLCPRECHLKDGDRGFCFVRQNVDGKMVLDTYGKSTGFCIDPIEKKPLNHFLPGTPVLSFGTAGCNLGCKFCQNWDISKSREVARLSDHAMPDEIAQTAADTGCRSVAFTYNDPIIWAEYAIDTATACRDRGIHSVAVTAGYLSQQARPEFFAAMDAANIDLKAFSESFYYRVTGSHLQPVLDTIAYACNETDCWVELTNLIIPNNNDDPDEWRRMCDWLVSTIGTDVPIHFTAFHPDFRLQNQPRTSHETLIAAYDLARQSGLRYVYVGNVHDVERQSTYCHGCGALLIQRDWHQLGHYAMQGNRCQACQCVIPGRFEATPGTWGQRRQRVKIQSRTLPVVPNEVRMSQTNPTDIIHWSDAEQDAIHAAACHFVATSVLGEDSDPPLSVLPELASRMIHGVYVTLKRGETLRGCCGMLGAEMSLGDALADSAARTTRDPRMSAISASELPYLTLSVSILGPPRPISARGDDRVDQVKIGQHGLRIRIGQNSGLLLPVVAIEQGWNAKQFLDAVCRKAGLPAGTWRSDQAELMLFDGIYFGGPFQLPETLGQSARDKLQSAERQAVSPAALSTVTRWISNAVAQASKSPDALGSPATALADRVDEVNVNGYMLRIRQAESSSSWLQLSLRDTIAMQASLQQTLRGARSSANDSTSPEESAEVALAVLTGPIHHGDAKTADLRGIDPQCRAIVATDGRRWSVRFDRESPPEQTLAKVLAAERFDAGTTQLYSLHCDSNVPALGTSLGIAAMSQFTVRPPAVADRFYSGADAQRDAEVDALISGLPPVAKRTVNAAMVPHAGLRFSGEIAADTWRRIELPRDVLIISPKHTGDGVDWAVAPYTRWQLSGDAALEGNEEMATSLAACHEGLELDSAAHRGEHGIEIQLPILYRLAPQTRVTAIAMRSATWEQLQDLAVSLAAWMKSQASPPLLVISSDMNHYADEIENRTRDRMALDALRTGDAKALLDVCEAENISMCGQVPAALVLLTLRHLGITPAYDEIAYATSAQYGGDPQRVVGYAGVLL